MKVFLTIPETYSDITVEQFQKFYKLTKENEQSDFVNQKTVEIFCQTQDAKYLSFHEIESIIKDINKVFESNPKHLKTFKIKNKEFGFVPNLDKMSFGEYVDVNNYIDNVEDFHKALAVLYRPITAKFNDMYEIEPYNGSDVYSDIMKDAPLDAIFGAKVFFYNLASELLKVTINSLEELPLDQKEIIQQKLNSLNGGDGTNLSTLLQKEMLELFKTSLN